MNRNLLVGLLVAAVLHAAAAIALSRTNPHDKAPENVSLVEVDAEEPPPPPPAPPPPPPVPEPPPPPEVKEEPVPEPEPEKPAPEPEKPAPEPEPPAPPPVDLGQIQTSDVADSTFADDGSWEITNVQDDPAGADGPVVVGADNQPVVVVVVPPPPPPPPPRPTPHGSGGDGAGTGTGTGPRAPEFRPAEDVSRPPEIAEEVRADYPEEARRDGVQGAVRLLVLIRKDGSVYRVRVLEDPGAGLGDAAKRALERFRFNPAIGQDGEPVDYQIYYTYRFVLDS